MKTFGGVEVWLHSFLISALDGGRQSARQPGRFTPGARGPGIPCKRDGARPTAVLGCFWEEKIRFPQLGIEKVSSDSIPSALSGLHEQWLAIQSIRSPSLWFNGNKRALSKLYIYKALPLHARSGPEGFRKLRFPDNMTTAPDGRKVKSLRTGRLNPQEMLLVLIYISGWFDPRAIVDRKDYVNKKFQWHQLESNQRPYDL